VVLTPFSGRVTRLIAKWETRVKRGDPLFEIDSPEVVQGADRSDRGAARDHQGQGAGRARQARVRPPDRLLADKATSMREVDQARNDFAAAESDLATAQGTLTAARNRLRVIVGRDQGEVERLERERVVNPLITINAPIDGTVIGRKVGPGQYVRSDAADSLYSIADLSTMWLKAAVPESEIVHVRVGQEIEVRLTALPDRVIKARISAVGAASDSATRRVTVRSEIPNPDRVLKSEMFASFKITTNGGEPCAVVPAAAVIRDGEQASVWVQRAPLMFQRRKVKVGLERDGLVQVLDGITAGEQVVGRGAVFVDNESRS
jgi:cobalt-zinc-cadmium efflux system membrane fusion protein